GELERLAVAWDCGMTEAVDRLVVGGATTVRVRRPRPASDPVALHAVYAGTRIDATFDIESCAVTVCSGLLRGQTYTSPSGAVVTLAHHWRSTVHAAAGTPRAPAAPASTPRRSVMPSTTPRRRAGTRPYPRLDLTSVHIPGLALVGTEGRAAMLNTAREHGYPHRTVTPALTRFSRVYVIQLGGNPEAGTVVLGTRDRREVVVKLPIDVRYRIVPLSRVEMLLAAIEADYPPGTPTAA